MEAEQVLFFSGDADGALEGGTKVRKRSDTGNGIPVGIKGWVCCSTSTPGDYMYAVEWENGEYSNELGYQIEIVKPSA